MCFMPTDKDDIKEFYDQSPDRGLAISLPVIIENRITSILQGALRHDEKIWNELFRPSGGAGTFSQKVNLAYMMHLIPEGLFDDLRILIKIRNRFAHELEIKSLEQHPISTWIREMVVYSDLKRIAETPVDLSQMTNQERTGYNIILSTVASPRETFRECVRLMIHHLYNLEVKVREAKTKILEETSK